MGIRSLYENDEIREVIHIKAKRDGGQKGSAEIDSRSQHAYDHGPRT